MLAPRLKRPYVKCGKNEKPREQWNDRDARWPPVRDELQNVPASRCQEKTMKVIVPASVTAAIKTLSAEESPKVLSWFTIEELGKRRASSEHVEADDL